MSSSAAVALATLWTHNIIAATLWSTYSPDREFARSRDREIARSQVHMPKSSYRKLTYDFAQKSFRLEI